MLNPVDIQWSYRAIVIESFLFTVFFAFSLCEYNVVRYQVGSAYVDKEKGVIIYKTINLYTKLRTIF